jgi:hypothetical protein
MRTRSSSGLLRTQLPAALATSAARAGSPGKLLPVVDLGPPSSYLALSEGVSVYSSDEQELGRVEHVLAETDVDIFDGIVIDRSHLPGGHRFVDAAEIEEIYDRGVVLKISAERAEGLPTPGANPATMSADPSDVEGGELERKLRRAWERISGRG